MALQHTLDHLEALGAAAWTPEHYLPVIPARIWDVMGAGARDEALALGYLPGMAGADGEGEGEGGEGGDGGEGGSGEGSGEGAGDIEASGDGAAGGGPGSGDGGIDWKQMARKHERSAKTAAKERADFEKRLKEYEDRDKTDQDRAVEAARDEGAAAVRAEMDQERRADRLENSVLKIAGRGLKIGDGDKAETVRFADPEDAIVHLERMIAKGDIAGDEIFNEQGRVQDDALSTALGELLTAKPHLRAPTGNENGNGTRKLGASDAGRGGDGGAKELEDMSADELYKLSKRQ